MKNIIKEEFESIRDAFDRKIEEVRDAFDDMSQKYNQCKDFAENVAKLQNWKLDETQKKKEERLCKEYEDSIDIWEKAFNDLKQLYGENRC